MHRHCRIPPSVRLSRTIVTTAFAFVFCVKVHAQSTTALDAQVVDSKTISPATTAETPVELSPFVVSSTQDTGYLAAPTLAGTRLNTQVKDLGASISI